MLSIMRRQAGSWMIKVLLFAIVVVFMFWGVGNFRSREATNVADINGEIVTYDAYRQGYDRLREQFQRVYGNAFNEQMAKALNLQQQALDQIVQRILMLQEAHKLDLQVADATVDESIAKVPAFQKNGTFDMAQANYVLAQNRISSAEFRNSVKEGILIEKLQALLITGITVPDAEAREWYEWHNTEVDLNYLKFASSQYKDISLSDDEIADYFKANENNYLTEPKVKVVYLFFDPDNYKDQVKVSPEEVQVYYDRHPDEFKSEKTVEARHILLKLDPDADAKTVAEKEQEAEKIRQMVLKGEQSFAALAKKYSEGPTRDQGGLLGAFKYDAMVKPFADKAFSMKAGEVSEPVRTKFGWHIIKVEKVNEPFTKTLEEASGVIRNKLIDEKASDLAMEKGDEIYESVFDGDDLAAAGKLHGLDAKTTDFFTERNFKEKGVDDTRRFAETAFELPKMAISDVIDVGNGFALLQVVDRKDAAVPPLDKVVDTVRADLTLQRQKEKAKADAEACLAEVQKGKSLAEAGSQFGLTPVSTGGFKRSGSIPGIGYDPQISKGAFALKKDKPLADKVYEGNQGWYVIQLKDRTLPDADGFAKEKEAIVSRLIEQKKQGVMQQWLKEVKARGKIEINYKLIQ